MLRPEDLSRIRRGIREQDPPHEVLLHIERCGNEAFDFIRKELESGRLTARRRANALLRLALLTRHHCRSRTEELLDLTLPLAVDRNPTARTGAVKLAIILSTLIEDFPAVVSARKYAPDSESPARVVVKTVVQNAMAIGLDQDTKEMAEEFLSGNAERGKTRPR